VTIVIGMIAQDGIVIASDREEGDSYLKSDKGKMVQVFRGRLPVGWIGVGGAGEGPEIDEVSGLLTDCFCADKERTREEAKAELLTVHRAYYEQKVLPFAKAKQLACPDYALIIGCLMGQTGKILLATSKLAVNSVDDYEAIGAGATVANIWLERLYERMPAEQAAKLAAYVVYQVKQSVASCGLGTDVLIINGRDLFGHVNREVIRRWEDAFRFFPSLERDIFCYCVGLQPSPILLRTKPDKDSIDLGINNLKKALSPPSEEEAK
jgi:20S proteasome alpha/beta subunit